MNCIEERLGKDEDTPGQSDIRKDINFSLNKNKADLKFTHPNECD